MGGGQGTLVGRPYRHRGDGPLAVGGFSVINKLLLNKLLVAVVHLQEGCGLDIFAMNKRFLPLGFVK